MYFPYSQAWNQRLSREEDREQFKRDFSIMMKMQLAMLEDYGLTYKKPLEQWKQVYSEDEQGMFLYYDSGDTVWENRAVKEAYNAFIIAMLTNKPKGWSEKFSKTIVKKTK